MPFASGASRSELAWTALAAFWLAGLALALGGPLHADEWAHWSQIRLFLAGEFTVMRQYLTNVPGYHWLQWALLESFGVEHFAWARVVNAGFALAGAAAFWSLRRAVHPADAARRTAMFLVLPILFPFEFLIYTDVLALGLLLASLAAAVRDRAAWSALLLLASMSIRQSHVLWGGLAAAFCLVPLLQSRAQRPAWRREALEAALPFALVLLVFLAYWSWNGTISYSTVQSQRAHPDLALEAGNVFFALALVALLLPLHVAAGVGRFARRVRAAHAWLLLPLAAGAIYFTQFTVDHPYNHFPVDGMLRNRVLMAVQSGAIAHSAFGGLGILAACALAAPRADEKRVGWLLAFGTGFLASSWLIETRYAMVPIALWLALAQSESKAVERATLAAWVVFAAILGYGVFAGHFMI